MSYPQKCIGCELGDHARHIPAPPHPEGLIGGTYCPCQGGCQVSPEVESLITALTTAD